MTDITKRVLEAKNKKRFSPVTSTIILVSLFWLLVAGTILAYIQHGHTEYDRGIFDGMTKTKTILQGK